MTDVNAEFKAYRAQLQKIIDKTARPADRVPTADVREIIKIVEKIGKLGARLRATANAALEPEPERADPLAAGAKLHAMALQAIKDSGHKLTYSQAWAGLVMEHWPLIQEWQQSVQVPRRRR